MERIVIDNGTGAGENDEAGRRLTSYLVGKEVMVMSGKRYADVVAQAEKAVQGVQDSELRKVAFAKIVEDLLGGRVRPSGQKATSGGQKENRTQKKNRIVRGPSGNVRELVADGFFKKPKTIGEVRTELVNRGHQIPLTSLSGPLQALCQEKTLRRQKNKAAGKRQGFSYSDF